MGLQKPAELSGALSLLSLYSLPSIGTLCVGKTRGDASLVLSEVFAGLWMAFYLSHSALSEFSISCRPFLDWFSLTVPIGSSWDVPGLNASQTVQEIPTQWHSMFTN